MRLTKDFYIVEEIEGEIVDYDELDRPIYAETDYEYRHFLGELEPYSAQLAEHNYGLYIEVTHRVFCEPNERIKIGETITYEDEKYHVTECLRYDKHYEVMLKKGDM
ncbi:hypothetical protein [Alteribacillus sp. YIM 98480]|uniref:hypothetical protein n=1 Tax=Alteribacillus sp. YIM 98480 TaxID=2606599 RepID=UPI00131E28CF|nr:hypothetical protein [Alteribacillus sp. YIM 98480]